MSEAQQAHLSVETHPTEQPARAFVQLFTEQEAVKMLGAAEVAKHKGHRLWSLTMPLGAGALSKKGTAPDRVLLFKYGANESTKGTFYLTEKNAPSILKAEADYGNDLVIDLDHRALFGDSRAVGWFSLELDAEGLYAGKPRHTEQDGLTGIWWLDEGKRLIESHQYRYISPVFWTTYDEEGREVIVEVLNFSLTNIPATKNRAPLINSRGEESRAMPEDSNLVVTTAQPSAPSAQATPAPAQQPAQQGATALSAADISSIMAAVHALTGETNPERIRGRLAALCEVQQQLNAERTAHAETRKALARERVDRLIEAGKLPPSKRERALAMSDAELAGFLEGLAGVVPASHVVVEQPAVNSDHPAAPATTLSKDEQELCQRYKLDPVLYAANKAKLYPRAQVASDRI